MDWENHLKKLSSIAERLKDGELSQAVLQLQREVVEEEKHRVERQEEEGRHLQYSPPAYWKVKGKEKEGPFCQVCWDTNHRLIRLQAETSNQMVCKVCGNRFGQEESSPFIFNPPF